MADITKCSGGGCPLKNNCYRYLASSSEWQSYFTDVPYDKKNLTCEYMWPFQDESALKELDEEWYEP